MLVQCEVRQVQCPVSAGAIPRRLLSRALALQALLITMLATNAMWLVFGSGIGPPDSVPAGHPMVEDRISGGLSVAGALATVVLGAAVVGGRVSPIRAMLPS